MTEPRLEPRGRIILSGRKKPGETAEIRGEKFSRLLEWKPRPGAAVTVSDEAGNFFRARVVRLASDRAELFIYETMPGAADSPLDLALLQALPDKERMELIIEKATELGVNLIAPWKAARGIDLSERETRQRKAHRWPERARRAAVQCRRASIPAIAGFCSLSEALAFGEHAELKVMLWEGGGKPLGEVLDDAGGIRSAAVLVGPEGGLSEEEVRAAEQAGFQPCFLGPRILRVETAAISALAILQHRFGDLGTRRD